MNFCHSCSLVIASYLFSVIFEVINIFSDEWISANISILEPMKVSLGLLKVCKKQEGLPVDCKACYG